MAFTMFMAGCANFPQLNPGAAPSEAPQRASGLKTLEKELSAAKERNARLETRVSESARKIERLNEEIRGLKQKNNSLGATLERLRRENIIARSFPASSPPRRPMRTPKPAPGKPPATPKKPGRASITPQALYNKSYRAVRDGKTEAAIRGFRLFLRLFPKSQLAAHSQYWLGEAYYALKQYPEALDEFLNLITRYPNSRKVPDAYYKRGLAYIRRNFPLNATLEFEKLVESFPSHPISKKARVQLQNLRHFTRKKPDDKK
ncbi:MAG: tol-pal system protein YbgF [Nitrospinae bacterium]|nr:tol-pal system protein YbgF [Nitrospinota bacterium]